MLRQYLDQPSCVVLLFISDEFICDTLRSMGQERCVPHRDLPTVTPIHTGPVLKSFSQGILAHFEEARTMPELLRLKFRELLHPAGSGPGCVGHHPDELVPSRLRVALESGQNC